MNIHFVHGVINLHYNYAKNISMRISVLIAAILIPGLLSSCEVPNSARYLKYSIDLSVNNHPYSFVQFIKCARYKEASEASPIIYERWKSTGDGVIAKKIDSNHILFFWVDADSYRFKPHELQRSVEILDTSSNQTKVYVIKTMASNPAVSVKRIYIEPVADKPSRIGPTQEQSDFTKNILNKYKYRFETVNATFTPYSRWALSPQSRHYFSKLSSITVAKVGEAPPLNGFEDRVVQFPFYAERNNLYSKLMTHRLQTVNLIFDGKTFVIPNQSMDNLPIYYLTKETNPVHSVAINYKNKIVNVIEHQQLYDPQTKNIIDFYHDSIPPTLEELIYLVRQNDYFSNNNFFVNY